MFGFPPKKVLRQELIRKLIPGSTGEEGRVRGQAREKRGAPRWAPRARSRWRPSESPGGACPHCKMGNCSIYTPTLVILCAQNKRPWDHRKFLDSDGKCRHPKWEAVIMLEIVQVKGAHRGQEEKGGIGRLCVMPLGK